MATNTQSNISLFMKRWNLSFNEHAVFSQFKNRIIFVVEEVLGDTVLNNGSLQNQYAYMLGEKAPIPTSGDFNSIYFHSASKTKGFRGTQMYQQLTQAENQVQLLWLLQNIFVLFQEGKYIDRRKDHPDKLHELILRVEKVFEEMPQVQVRLHHGKNGVLILPNGAKSLDVPLVNDVLDWLDDYPQVMRYYQEALLMLLDNDPSKYRNLLDNLRLALELLLKAVLKNNERLEEQAKPLKVWMAEKGVQENIRLIFSDIIGRNRFTQLMNEDVKHGDRKWDTAEVEFLVYQTGVFFRFIIEINQWSPSGIQVP